MAANPITAPLSPEVADRLLDLLSTDDAFREAFQRDHLDALRTLGYQSPEPAKMTACGLVVATQPEPFDSCKVTNLAPKDVIRAAREEILAMLTSGLAQTTPSLDTGNDSRRTRR
jgi:putative modified peptide